MTGGSAGGLLLAGWNLLNFDSGEFRPDAQSVGQWNRGAYIVEGLGHCGDCHTPKGYFGGANRSEALSGGYASGARQGWFAPSLAGERRAGLGGWSAAEIVEYLKTGSNAHAVTAGPMNEVIADSTSHFTDADLEAVAVYLKSLPPSTRRPSSRRWIARRSNAARASSPISAQLVTWTTAPEFHRSSRR